jgi:hypothetical protein
MVAEAMSLVAEAVYLAWGQRQLLALAALRAIDEDIQIVAAHRGPWPHRSVLILH